MSHPLDVRPYLQGVGFTFRALANPNFRLYFLGQLVSLHGTWIQLMAMGWMVYGLTDSPFWLGLVGFAGQVPALLLMPLAGVLADRLNRQRVLLLTQVFAMVLALAMAALALMQVVTLWHILVIAALNGVVVAFDTPFRHAFVHQMLGGPELLQNAIALSSTMINSARFIGPVLGGFLIHWVGEGLCFLINGLSYLAIIGALAVMRVPPPPTAPQRPVLRELREGLSYSFGHAPIRYLLLLVIAASLVGLPFQVFLPVFARDILMGDSQTLGLLAGAVGAGALLGALFLTTRRDLQPFPTLIASTMLIFGLGLGGVAVATHLYLSLAMLAVAGFGMIVVFAATNTLLQTVVRNSMRGRVMSLYGMSFIGFAPLGSLAMGALSAHIGVPHTVLIAGGLCLLSALAFMPRIGRIEQAVSQRG